MDIQTPMNERSSHQVYRNNPEQEKYDDVYRNEISPMIKGRVLDLGIGTGIFWEKYIDRNKTKSITYVLGIDNIRDNFLYFDEKIIYLEHDLNKGLPKMTAKFDTILTLELLQFIKKDSIDKLFSDIKGVLSTNGFLIGSVPSNAKTVSLVEWLDNNFYIGDIWKKDECILWRAGKPKFVN